VFLCAHHIEAVGDICEVPTTNWSRILSTEAEEAAAEKNQDAGRRQSACLVTSARVDKVWPPSAGVIARLLKDVDLPIIMLGAPGKDFELAKQVQEQVKVLNGSDRNLHLALSTNLEFPNWPIRRVLAQALAADVVVTPDTGPAWAVAQKPMRKIVLLSHASQENITKGWKNTLTLHADPSVACWPCHLLIDRPEDANA
jgi:ADP-heptose:LPS heptosyltransferase